MYRDDLKLLLRLTSHGSAKVQTAGEYLGRVLQSLSSQHGQENSVLEAMAPATEAVVEEWSTWLEAAEEQVCSV